MRCRRGSSVVQKRMTSINDLPDTVLNRIIEDAGMFQAARIANQIGTVLNCTARVCKRWKRLINGPDRVRTLHGILRKSVLVRGGELAIDGSIARDAITAATGTNSFATLVAALAGAPDGESEDMDEDVDEDDEVEEEEDAVPHEVDVDAVPHEVEDDAVPQEVDVDAVPQEEKLLLENGDRFFRRFFTIYEQSPTTGGALFQFHSMTKGMPPDHLMISAASLGLSDAVHRIAVDFGDQLADRTWIDAALVAAFYGHSHVVAVLLASYNAPPVRVMWNNWWNTDAVKLLLGWREMPGYMGFVMHIDDSSHKCMGRDGRMREVDASGGQFVVIEKSHDEILGLAVDIGNVELVRTLLARNPSLAAGVSKYRITRVASENKHAIVKMLLEANRDKEKEDDILCSAVLAHNSLPDAEMMDILVEDIAGMSIDPMCLAELILSIVEKSESWSDDHVTSCLGVLNNGRIRLAVDPHPDAVDMGMYKICQAFMTAAFTGRLQVVKLFMEPPPGSNLDGMLRADPSAPNRILTMFPDSYGDAIVRAGSVEVRNYLFQMLPPVEFDEYED